MRKTCIKCKKEHPATAKFFYKSSTGKDGLKTVCKKCYIEYQKQNQKRYYQTFNGYLRKVYADIKHRCNNPKDVMYYRYGGRGIKNRFVSFHHFFIYVTNVLNIATFKQIKGLEIDRIDNDGHYEVGNMRFVTVKENRNNK